MSTWNLYDTSSNITISADNLTITRSSTGLGAYADTRGTLGHTTGRWYFEIKILSTGNNLPGFGIGSSIADLSSAPGDGPQSMAIYLSGSTTAVWFMDSQNISGTMSGIGWNVNDIMQFAVDCEAQTIWATKNGLSSLWNGGAGTPEKATGGSTWDHVSKGTRMFPISGLSALNTQITGYFSSNTLNFTPPQGFVAWDSREPTINVGVTGGSFLRKVIETVGY